MTDRIDLSALIGSRICHDLISPIGAIGNGVELMLMDGAAKGPELSLISESVSNANARIRFFRVAFGAAGGDARIARTEVQSILADMARGGRTRIDWVSSTDLDRREVKLAFLAIQCLETSMPWGGRIVVEQADRWIVTGQAARLKIDLALWDMLSTRALNGVTAAHVHFAVLPDEIERQGRRLTVTLSDSEARIAF
jgi:histidine phosphotransferase ChpT